MDVLARAEGLEAQLDGLFVRVWLVGRGGGADDAVAVGLGFYLIQQKHQFEYIEL